MDAGDVCYQVARKGTNHFSAGFEGVMMDDSGEKPLAGFWKAVQPAQLPMRGDANQRPTWALLTSKLGPGGLRTPALASLQALIWTFGVKKQTLGF